MAKKILFDLINEDTRVYKLQRTKKNLLYYTSRCIDIFAWREKPLPRLSFVVFRRRPAADH